MNTPPGPTTPLDEPTLALVRKRLDSPEKADVWTSLLCIVLGSILIAVTFAVQVLDGKYHRLGVGEFITMISAGVVVIVAGVSLRAYRLKRIHQTLRFVTQAASAPQGRKSRWARC